MFCNVCGASVSENADAGQADANSEKKVPVAAKPAGTITVAMQFLRGIPFGLVFFAFLLPLIGVSCSGMESRDFSTYEFLTLSKNVDVMDVVGNFVRENLGNVHIIAILVAVLIGLTILAFAWSFVSGSLGAILGICSLVDLVVIAGFIYNKVKAPFVSIDYKSGFVVSIILLLTGIVMGFISPRNVKSVPSGLFIGLGIVGALAPIIWTLTTF